jgi:hypothetical protein
MKGIDIYLPPLSIVLIHHCPAIFSAANLRRLTSDLRSFSSPSNLFEKPAVNTIKKTPSIINTGLDKVVCSVAAEGAEGGLTVLSSNWLNNISTSTLALCSKRRSQPFMIHTSGLAVCSKGH